MLREGEGEEGEKGCEVRREPHRQADGGGPEREPEGIDVTQGSGPRGGGRDSEGCASNHNHHTTAVADHHPIKLDRWHKQKAVAPAQGQRSGRFHKTKRRAKIRQQGFLSGCGKGEVSEISQLRGMLLQRES
jgi:hypothetical protein